VAAEAGAKVVVDSKARSFARYGEIDLVNRAALFLRMNDIVIGNVVVIPVLWRNGVSGSGQALMGMDLTGWDSTLWRLPYWYKQA